MANVTKVCSKCGRQYNVLDQEQKFLQEKGLPMPTLCPADRQLRRLQLRGSRSLFRTKCQQCGKEIIVSYDPAKVTNPILCKQDYEQYFSQHDPIIADPLP